jgi:hypothetical protein
MQDYRPYFYINEGKVVMSVLGPKDGTHWAGAYTPDELERVGVKAIQAAQEYREKLAQEEQAKFPIGGDPIVKTITDKLYGPSDVIEEEMA